MTDQSSSSFLQLPSTKTGWWAVGLAVTYAGMGIINTFVFMRLPEDAPWRQTLLPYYGILMVLCGLSAGVVALIAVMRNGERSWLVWLTIVQWVFTLALVMGEFLIAH
ncbi:MAG: hypothetical protein ACYC11_09655 [Bellilinea sp.]